MRFLVCCVLPDKKLYGNCLSWLNILYWKFFHLALRNSLPWNFPLYWIYFLPFRIFEQPALALKDRVCPERQSCPEIFHCIEYTFIFRIFEHLALALKNRMCPEFTALNICFYRSGLLSILHLPWKTELTWKFSLYWNIFYHSGLLCSLRLPLPWKQSLPWIHCTIQDFWTTCACLEKHKLPWNFSLY